MNDKDGALILVVLALFAFANWCSHFAQEKREERILNLVQQILYKDGNK